MRFVSSAEDLVSGDIERAPDFAGEDFGARASFDVLADEYKRLEFAYAWEKADAGYETHEGRDPLGYEPPPNCAQGVHVLTYEGDDRWRCSTCRKSFLSSNTPGRK